MTDQITINYYHRWAFIDEMQSLINAPINESIQRYQLNDGIVKAVRALSIADTISRSIIRSFMHDAHPSQIDDFRRLDWVCALLKVMNDWHAITHRFFKTLQFCYQSRGMYTDFDLIKPEFPDHYTAGHDALLELQLKWSKRHAASLKLSDLEWNQFMSSIMDQAYVNQIYCDRHENEIERKYAYIEPFFRGIHQILESLMTITTNMIGHIVSQLRAVQVSSEGFIADSNQPSLISIRGQLADIQIWWEIAAKHIMLLSKMDTGSYAEYRQALLGTSGGDSRQLRALKASMMSLHFNLPASLQSDHVLKINLHKHPQDDLLNQILTSIREAQAASSDFWMRHFTLTANTIGITRGSHGLPVEKLLSFAVAPLMKSDSLLKSVAEVGNDYAETPEAVLVEVNQRSVVIGKSIYNHIKDNVKYISEYDRAVNMQEGMLDHFELGVTELNDSSLSPYHKWFDVDINTHITRFEMHSFGSPLVFFYDSLTRTSKRMMSSQNDYWQVYFSERWLQFKSILFRALSISESSLYTTTLDVNASALLERLLSAIPADRERNIVISSQHEFIATKRILSAWQQCDHLDIQTFALDADTLNLAEPFIDAVQRAGSKLKCVIFSQVFSNSQISLTQDEIISILDAVPVNVPVIIDAVQGVFNVPCDWGAVLSSRTNVYVLGTAIKHARSTSGLAFMIYPVQGGVLHHPRQSGWCAYLSGMSDGVTTDDSGRLLYDETYQWCGGTPGNVFALELFINTWDAILRAGESVTTIHRYTQSLIQSFSKALPHDLYVVTDAERRHHFPHHASNALTLKLRSGQAQSILDHAHQRQMSFDKRQQLLRLGFGMQHGMREIQRLLEVFSDH